MSNIHVSGQFEDGSHKSGYYPASGRNPSPHLPSSKLFGDLKIDVVRAWTDEAYLTSLSDAERAMLPSNPAGLIELTDAELGGIAGSNDGLAMSGGTPVFTVAFTTSLICPVGSFLLTACLLTLPMPNAQPSINPDPTKVCYA